MTMTNQGTDWAGRPLKPLSGRSPDEDTALLTRLEGIQQPSAQDRGALAALRIRTPSGTSDDMRVWSLTERWNKSFSDAKATAQGKEQGQQEPEFLR